MDLFIFMWIRGHTLNIPQISLVRCFEGRNTHFPVKSTSKKLYLYIYIYPRVCIEARKYMWYVVQPVIATWGTLLSALITVTWKSSECLPSSPQPNKLRTLRWRPHLVKFIISFGNGYQPLDGSYFLLLFLLLPLNYSKSYRSNLTNNTLLANPVGHWLKTNYLWIKSWDPSADGWSAAPRSGFRAKYQARYHYPPKKDDQRPIVGDLWCNCRCGRCGKWDPLRPVPVLIPTNALGNMKKVFSTTLNA